ncbi:NAD(+) diphosphatase [Chondromyces crocatus]|uniref:NAD(+) diphosphatase n=1 Tax=Chondromyces crocatus TaxID=52 RepID=A0A0K1E8L2_CHOCO|nr:NAD(+) diphosphatase [Chondromyces crocatus]AKT37195.1 NADH pyrophosphatase [Chondromyces crocatus]
MPSRFRSSVAPVPTAGVPGVAPVPATWFAFRHNDLLVRDPSGSEAAMERAPAVGWGVSTHDAPLELPQVAELSALGLSVVRQQVLGVLDGQLCFSAELPQDAKAPEGYAFVSLRRLFGRVDVEVYDAAGVAFQVQYWDRVHQVCSACGAALEARGDERCKRCASCRLDYYPRVAPAMIALIEDGPRVLLTRGPRFPPGMYGLVAGFVEPGESLEGCVAREVMEETGIEVTDIRYFGSQPWPFPHQVMIGFTARYGGGELRVDPRELEDARWFHRDEMPPLPPPISIARKLIDAWLARGA